MSKCEGAERTLQLQGRAPMQTEIWLTDNMSKCTPAEAISRHGGHGTELWLARFICVPKLIEEDKNGYGKTDSIFR